MEAVARLIEPLERETSVRLQFQYNRHGPSAPGGDPVIQKILSCPAGTQAGFVSPDGTLYACGCAADWLSHPIQSALVAAGSVRDAGPTEVWDLWQRAPVWARYRDRRSSKAPACFACPHYGVGCFGSCPVHAQAANGEMNAPDPMCALSAPTTDEQP
jgi:radical SAM protein with 4Fe4S-binding SPASM domain